MNNKITGLRLTSVLLPALMVFGLISLNGCSSSQPVIQSEPEPVAEVESMEPMEQEEPILEVEEVI